MSATSSSQHNPPSVASIETPISEHDDDLSVTASDDVEVTSPSATTDPSVTEHDQPNIEDKSAPSLKTIPPPSSSRGPVQLLRRPPNPTLSPQTSRQATQTAGETRQPSPTRTESVSQTPTREPFDPSLLEAFANPMNRQYLLQLEARLNEFVTQSKSDTLELPPTNSFFRCLAHKMADHYKLQHVADSGHVILFRSQYARIPETRLSELSKPTRTPGSSASSSEDGTISAPEFKQIMKRVPGKPAKDGEDDAKSESSQSQALSHEERQAVYEKTRARIFADYVESQGEPAAEKGSDAGSETSSMRREKSLHRSDSFQTRQQFAREATPYASYAAALTGQQPQMAPIQGSYSGYPPAPLPQPGYIGFPSYPPQYPYPYPPLPPQSSRESNSRDQSRSQSGAASPATTRNDSPSFQPNPFAREFVPTGASGGGSGIPRSPIRPKESTTPPIQGSTPPASTTAASRNSTPPSTQQVKKTASFENNSSTRPLTPTPTYTRSQSASSMRPTPQQQYPSLPAYPPTQPISYMNQQMLPFAPPMLLTARQTEWGPPLTTGTIRYVANGQPIPPQVLPYRAHPMPMPPLKPPMYTYPPAIVPQPRNGIVQPAQDMDTFKPTQGIGSEETLSAQANDNVEAQAHEEEEDITSEECKAADSGA